MVRGALWTLRVPPYLLAPAAQQMVHHTDGPVQALWREEAGGCWEVQGLEGLKLTQATQTACGDPA